jgi:preprotein translocase subunit SecD
VCARARSLVRYGLLLLVCVGCGGEGDDAERFAIYHLETSVGRPRTEGELRCGPPRVACPGVVEQPAPRESRYAVLAPPFVTEDGLDLAGANVVTDPATGGAAVAVPFTDEGRAAFARLTREVARVGGRDQTWHHLAIVVDGEIVAFPEVDFDAYPDGFPDAPSLQIEAMSLADARSLVERLRGD